MEVRPIYINPRHVVAIVADRYNYRLILTGRVEVVGSKLKIIRRGKKTWYYVEGSLYHLELPT